MAFIDDIAERSVRAGLSLKHHVEDELNAHAGWWIPSLAACLVWVLLPRRKAHR